jgi:electron transport complex protein RnfG
VAATSLALVYNYTKEPIAYQQRLKKLNAIRVVQPDFDNEPDKDLIDLAMGDENEKTNTTRCYLTKRGDVCTGAVFTSSAIGYGGTIEVLLGVAANGTITGVQILDHSETPGLGAKVTEENFLHQFKGKNLSSTKWALKKEGGGLDGITGATISPRAVVKAIYQGLVVFQGHRDKIIKGPEG